MKTLQEYLYQRLAAQSLKVRCKLCLTGCLFTDMPAPFLCFVVFENNPCLFKPFNPNVASHTVNQLVQLPLRKHSVLECEDDESVSVCFIFLFDL